MATDMATVQVSRVLQVSDAGVKRVANTLQ